MRRLLPNLCDVPIVFAMLFLLQSPSILAISNSTTTTECKMSDKSQAAVTLYTMLVMTAIISTLTHCPIESFILHG